MYFACQLFLFSVCVLFSRHLMSVLLQEVQTALQKNCGSRSPSSAVITRSAGQSDMFVHVCVCVCVCTYAHFA